MTFILLKVKDKDTAKLATLIIPCKNYNIKMSVFEDYYFVMGKDVDLEKLDLNQLLKNPNILEILCRREG